ncbi:unnamed protein product [Pleuronectes platessa]|uniref:Uncharacterized protein n=1 Tax=Pleuronectes platessa TaxID=8262 RepID=A0A9N7ZAB3_PLEPL|nr:unnamed protein product [Pleuronectes platessa]
MGNASQRGSTGAWRQIRPTAAFIGLWFKKENEQQREFKRRTEKETRIPSGRVSANKRRTKEGGNEKQQEVEQEEAVRFGLGDLDTWGRPQRWHTPLVYQPPALPCYQPDMQTCCEGDIV